MSIICQGCGYRVETVKIFDRSKKTGKPYLLTKCARESCGFFADIEDYTGKSVPPQNKSESGVGDEKRGRGFWRSDV